MVIDHDEEVHKAVLFALAGIHVLGRRVEFLHASSEQEARSALATYRDIAIVLLNVTWIAGASALPLVRFMREECELDGVRIVLRTTQPGRTRELRRFERYDISDHRMKSELTHARLATTIVSAIRSYQQMQTIEAGRRGLQKIADGSSRLLAQRTIREFSACLLAQCSDLQGMDAHGFVCTGVGGGVDSSIDEDYRISAGAGRYSRDGGGPLSSIDDATAVAVVRETLAKQATVLTNRGLCLFLPDRLQRHAVAYLDTSALRGEIDRQLLGVFQANAATGYENCRLFERLESQVYIDALTGLPNRTWLVEQIDAVDVSARAYAAVAIVEIEHFAEINESLGHQSGDLLLVAIAGRLRSSLPAAVAVARIDGNSFALFGPETHLDPDLIVSHFRQSVPVGTHSLHVSVSMGFARLAVCGSSGLDVLKCACIGLSHARQRRGQRYSFFTKEMEAETRERMKLANDLRRSIMSQQFLLHYQPQIDLATGRVVGAESLLRWRNADGAFIPPDKFIPVAESSGLIRPIGEWVLRTACHQLRVWTERGLDELRLAVNVSIDQFRMPDFVDRVRTTIEEFGIDPARLELEITESMAMDEIEIVAAALANLKALGVAIALDDFGTGFSSLGYLAQLSVDRLKIDRSFVSGIRSDGEMANARSGKDLSGIPEMVIKLGHSLGLRVIAEGVEDEHQARWLRDLGCDEAQGYHYARPMAADAFEAWMQGAARNCSEHSTRA